MRIAKSQNTWEIAHCQLLRNKVIAPRIKLILWNSLIRSTAIYGLHTKELPRNLIERMEIYMCKQIRTMMNPRRKDEEWYPEKQQLYQQIQQPTAESWINKTQVLTMLTQTREMKTIHPKQCKEMILPGQKLQAQWKSRNNALQEKTQRPEKGNY